MARVKEPESHFCHGYTDENGIWNNGFYCPKWGDPSERYCCSDDKSHFCCPPPPLPTLPSSTLTRLPIAPLHPFEVTTASTAAGPRPAVTSLVAIIAGATTGVFFIAICFILCFAVCRWMRRRRRRKEESSRRKDTLGGVEQGTLGRCEQGSLGRRGDRVDGSRPSQACGSNHLHCGCAPGNHHHPHIDNVETTRLQDTLDWPPELDQVVRLRFDEPPPYHPETRAASPASDVSKLSALSSEHKLKRLQPDLLCLSSFRPPGLGMSPSGLTMANLTRADMERCTSSGMGGMSGVGGGLGLTRADLERSGLSRAELERCKRDSGVLIEDTDTTSDDNSTITMLSNIHQHFSHLRLVPPPAVNAILRQTTISPRSVDGSISPCGTNSS